MVAWEALLAGKPEWYYKGLRYGSPLRTNMAVTAGAAFGREPLYIDSAAHIKLRRCYQRAVTSASLAYMYAKT